MLSRSLFKTRKAVRAGRPAWKCAEEFKRWLRKLACACGGRNEFCRGAIAAAHVDIAGGKGVSTKVADRHCIPLSDACHRHQTDVIGWPEFEKLLPMGDAVALAAVYWTEWPGRAAWERQFAEEGATSDHRARA
jgi:hypothetical protein